MNLLQSIDIIKKEEEEEAILLPNQLAQPLVALYQLPWKAYGQSSVLVSQFLVYPLFST